MVEIQCFKHIYTACIARTFIVCYNCKLDNIAYIDDIFCNSLVYAEVNMSGYINRSDVVLVVAQVGVNFIAGYVDRIFNVSRICNACNDCQGCGFPAGHVADDPGITVIVTSFAWNNAYRDKVIA